MTGCLEHLDHVVLYTGDAEATLAFYRDVVGCAPVGVEAWRAGERPVFGLAVGSTGTYLNVHPPGRELHPRAQVAEPGTQDLCFRVRMTPAEVAAHLAAQAIPVEVADAPRVDALGRPSISFYVRDPNGNLVELMVAAS